MAEDRHAQDEPKDDDFEAHKKVKNLSDELRAADESDDVEAHKKVKNLSDELRATDESDDSDDVEAHRKNKV